MKICTYIPTNTLGGVRLKIFLGVRGVRVGGGCPVPSGILSFVLFEGEEGIFSVFVSFLRKVW